MQVRPREFFIGASQRRSRVTTRSIPHFLTRHCRGARSTRRLLNTLIRIDCLLIDELGYVNLRPEQTNIFFKLMEERYRRKPTIITSNLI